jgi:hypothetical protein
MTLIIGSEKADTGMSKAIYDELDKSLSTELLKAIDDAETADAKEAAKTALSKSREGWQKLAYAISKGVINHLKTHMEIKGITTSGTINNAVKDSKTDAAAPADHTHSLTFPHAATKLEFTQNDDGTGHVA